MNASALDKASVKMVEERLTDYLGGEEIAKYESLNAERKSDWLSGRVALKNATLRFCPSRNNFADIVIDNLPNGEPYIIGRKKIFCSIAHSHSWGVGAASSERIGVDIEQIKPHSEDLMRYLADKQEIESLAKIFNDPSDLITVIWTVKEAVLKGLGIGFELSPKQLKIFASGKEALMRVEVQPQEHASVWWVTLQKKKNFFISIASQKNHEKQEVGWYNPACV